MLETKTTEQIFNDLCGDAHTNFISEGEKEWISKDSLYKLMEQFYQQNDEPIFDKFIMHVKSILK